VPRRLRVYLKTCWAYFLWGTGALRWAKRRLARRGAVTVLMLHRVLDDAEYVESSSLPAILVRERTFDELLAWAAKEYEIVDLGRGAPDWSVRPNRPRIALTFDDGWLDNLRYAWPVAARRGASITIFVCAGLVGRRFPFWPEQVNRSLQSASAREQAKQLFPDLADGSMETLREDLVDRLKQTDPALRDEYVKSLQRHAGASLAEDESEPCNQMIAWDQVRELHRSGVRIGSHTVSHPILTQLSKESVAAELSESRRWIERELGSECALIAYPNGNHDPEICRLAREAGYSLAFTTQPGAWVQETDPARIPRINISEPKLVGPRGRFSRVMFEYSVFWRNA